MGGLVTVEERYRELLSEMREHNYRYHVLDAPVVDDNTYDTLPTPRTHVLTG